MSEVEKYIIDEVNKINSKYHGMINDETLKKAISHYSDSNLDDVIDEIDVRISQFEEEYLKSEEDKKEILRKQKETYQYSRNVEEQADDGIEAVNIEDISFEDLDKMCFHYSLKKDRSSIAENGLQSRVGRNSENIDKKESIYFSYGIEGVLETWDMWLKWRLNRLNNPEWNDEYKDIRALIDSGQASDEQKKEYYHKIELWDDEFLSQGYKDDRVKLDLLYKFQLDEMEASNYYLLDLIEGEDFTFDELDVKKEKAKGTIGTPEEIEYKRLAEMYGTYSDMDNSTVEKHNMNTILGKHIVLQPERIKHLILSDGRDDVYSVLEHLYDRYKENVSKDEQAQFDLLDDYIEFCKERNRNKQNDEQDSKSQEKSTQDLGRETISEQESTQEKDAIEHMMEEQERAMRDLKENTQGLEN